MTVIDIRQSALRTWLRCRRKSYLRYDMGWSQQQEAGDVRGIGSYWHGLAAEYYGDIEFKPKELDFSFGEGDVVMAVAMFNTYKAEVERDGLDAFQKTLSVEKRIFSHPIDVALGVQYRISCQVDQVYEDEAYDLTVGRDHKTSAQFFQTADNDFQLLTYNVVLEDNGVVCDMMEHNIIKRNKRTIRAKPPYIQRNNIFVSPEMRGSFRRQLEFMCKEHYVITTGAGSVEHPALYAVADKTCASTCDFVGICGSIDDGGDYIDTLHSEYYQEEAPQ